MSTTAPPQPYSPPANNLDGFTKTLTPWRDVVFKASEAHYAAQRFFNHRNKWIGAVAIVASTIATASVLKAMADGSVPVLVVVVVLTLVAAVASALQTFLKDGDRAERHRLTGAGYAAVLRRIDQGLYMSPAADAERVALADEIRTEMDKLSKEAPELPGPFVRGLLGAGKASGT